jgi:hypothetical protein
MPLVTELQDRAGRTRRIPWSWEDRCILARFVLLDGGKVGEITGIEAAHVLEWGYHGAGCDHVFAETYGYSQVDTKKTIWCRPGQKYREYRES